MSGVFSCLYCNQNCGQPVDSLHSVNYVGHFIDFQFPAFSGLFDYYFTMS